MLFWSICIHELGDSLGGLHYVLFKYLPVGYGLLLWLPRGLKMINLVVKAC